MTEKTANLPVGVVVRRQPGVTRWARWVWRPVAVLPGAEPADWRELRRDGEVVDYHAATVTLTLHRSETEDYRIALSNDPPCLYVVMRTSEDAPADRPYEVHAVTASPFEAQEVAGTGEEMVEPVPLPEALAVWIGDFVQRHHVETPFVKRKRGPSVQESAEEGLGDARIRQDSDVYRSPAQRRRDGVH